MQSREFGALWKQRVFKDRRWQCPDYTGPVGLWVYVLSIMDSFKKSLGGLKTTTQSATKGVTDSAGTNGYSLLIWACICVFGNYFEGTAVLHLICVLLLCHGLI